MVSFTMLFLCMLGSAIIGSCVGLFFSAMCFASKRSDEIIEYEHNKKAQPYQ
ncbi:MAG: hypothetical protein H6Q69_1768 [Firmicutes bacterium]|nr:hypothetical protein [Bacillota bacterium]